ncbi:MAG: hypothetical protein MJE68_04380, partial [Proteobacteria bacterium]|nr:hypothetical protein [Pseudomonadota bacterium]
NGVHVHGRLPGSGRLPGTLCYSQNLNALHYVMIFMLNAGRFWPWLAEKFYVHTYIRTRRKEGEGAEILRM